MEKERVEVVETGERTIFGHPIYESDNQYVVFDSQTPTKPHYNNKAYSFDKVDHTISEVQEKFMIIKMITGWMYNC